MFRPTRTPRLFPPRAAEGAAGAFFGQAPPLDDHLAIHEDVFNAVRILMRVS
jgi:hypothetical protein